MARCQLCGAETSLYDAGVPVCVPCSEKIYGELRKRELDLLRKATKGERQKPGQAKKGSGEAS
jgi:hypothetical protein